MNAGRIASTARDPGRLRRWARAISALLLVSPSAVQAARAEPVEPPAAPDTRARPRLVLTSGYGLTFGVSPRPSLDAALLVGGSVSARWAIGYQGTLSLGWAERYVLGLITTRHHIAAVRGATSGKTLASVAVGVALLRLYQHGVLEVEGRIGRVLQDSNAAQSCVVLGLLVRVGWHFHAQETLPMPQLGLWIGFTRHARLARHPPLGQSGRFP